MRKLTLVFLSNPVPFDGQDYEKQKEPETSNQSLFRLHNKFRKVTLLVIYYLTKFNDVIWSGFWVISKITSATLWKSIQDIISHSTFICTFESGKCGKEAEKLQKFEYLENKKSFLNGIFYSFRRAIIWWKNKK